MSETIRLDKTDKQLLELVQGDGRMSVADLAEQVNLSPTPCWRRLRRLEDAGVIQGYQARLDRRKLGWGVLAFVRIKLERERADAADLFERTVAAIPSIVACHRVSGESDYLLQVIAGSLDDYAEFSHQMMLTLPGVKETHTSFSLKEIKQRTGIPVEPFVAPVRVRGGKRVRELRDK